MLPFDGTARNGDDVSRLRCPCCGSAGMRYHGSYRRTLLDLGANLSVERRRVWVDRAICPACSRTHALLPPNVVAYSPVSVRLSCAIASLALASGGAAASRWYRVCEARCRSIRADAPRLAALLHAAAWELAGVLAARSSDPASCASLSLSFASSYGTTPFSGVRFANAARRAAPRPPRPT